MRLLIIFTLILSLQSCGSRQISLTQENSFAQGNIKVESALFSEFLDSLQSHKTPLLLHCGLSNYVLAYKFKKYKQFLPPDYVAVYGLIGQTENVKCIIFGQGFEVIPTLFTYNNSGERIDSLSLILNPCTLVDLEQTHDSFALIKEDLTIELTDTTTLIQFSENPEAVDDYIVDSLRIVKVAFKIDKKGKFVKQK